MRAAHSRRRGQMLLAAVDLPGPRVIAPGAAMFHETSRRSVGTPRWNTWPDQRRDREWRAERTYRGPTTNATSSSRERPLASGLTPSSSGGTCMRLTQNVG